MLTLDNLNTQKIELHTNTEEIKLLSPLPSAQNPHTLITETLLLWNIFLFYPDNRLGPLQILSYWELNIVAPISSLAVHKILFYFSWLSIIILILKSTYSPDFKQKQSVGFVYSWAKRHHFLPRWGNFGINFKYRGSKII